jgi:hypothetical protein
MAYKQFLLKIDEELLEQFKKACGSKDMSEVMIKLIKRYMRDKELEVSLKTQAKTKIDVIDSDKFNKLSEIEKQIVFSKYIEDLHK